MSRVERRCNVLFVCADNAACSIMAEAILAQAGSGRMAAYSAGCHPLERVDPQALEQVERAGMTAGSGRPKSWEMFAWPGAPRMDIVITLCATVAGRPLPQFPGDPILLNWPIGGPAIEAQSQDGARRAYEAVFADLAGRIQNLIERVDRAQPWQTDGGKSGLRKALAGSEGGGVEQMVVPSAEARPPGNPHAGTATTGMPSRGLIPA